LAQLRRRKAELDGVPAVVTSIVAHDLYRSSTLRKNGGDAFAMLPDPARRLFGIYGIKYHGVFIIDLKGVIRWSLVADGNPEGQRPDADAIIAEVKKLAR
jgi:hypothetical protein